MSSKRKAILDRIHHLEEALTKGREYLECGKHAHWHGFRPVFVDKCLDGELVAPHQDWVRKSFLPMTERALKRAWDQLEKVT